MVQQLYICVCPLMREYQACKNAEQCNFYERNFDETLTLMKNKHKFVHIRSTSLVHILNFLYNAINYSGILYGQEQKFTLKMAPKFAISGPTLMQNVFFF